MIEVAVVLAIVALLLGGMLLPLTAQVEQQKTTQTRRALEEIKEALIGYALIYGKLPCPTTTTDPAHANYGVADASCTAAAAEGYLPWKTLDVAETDAWGSKRSQAAAPWTGYWRYRVDANFTTAFSLATSGSLLQVRDSAGNTLTTTTERPLAVVFSSGKNLAPDGQNASFENAAPAVYQSDGASINFDDETTWVSRHILINRMVAAGKLP